MEEGKGVVLAPTEGRKLSNVEFHQLADVPPEVGWFANIQNPNTRRAYQNGLRHFMRFVGIAHPQEFRSVTRAHVIAWRIRRGVNFYLIMSGQSEPANLGFEAVLFMKRNRVME